jgi:hypothetical protein
MRTRVLAVLVVLSVLAFPALALDRGNVVLKVRTLVPPANTPGFDLWLHFGWTYAGALGALPEEPIAWLGADHFLMPAPNPVLFHDGHTLSIGDGTQRVVFHDDAHLGEIAPLRGGRFLVAEQSGAKLIEFDLRGRLADFDLPGGALHIEALANNCAVLYSTGTDARVRRANICSGAADGDFASLPEGNAAGAIRQLPGGDVLVAGGSAVFHFTSAGALLRMYPMSGVTHIALAPDGATFWAAGVDGGSGFLRHVDPRASSSESVPLGNPGMQTIEVPQDVSDLVVAGEWRAAAQPIRGRAAGR